MIKPIVSVVMITYGHQDYILEAIEGVLMQQYDGQIELIIANDNSPDSTHNLITNYLAGKKLQKDLLIKYTKHEVNKGMNPNFIWALEQASGKYTALCEGDDYWTDPLKLQKQVDFLEKNSLYSSCFTNARVVNEISQERYPFIQSLQEGLILSKTLLLHGGGIYPTASLVFKTNCINYEIFDTIKELNGDELLIFSLSFSGKIYFIDEKTCVYRRWTGGVYSNIIESNSLIVKQKKKDIVGYEKLLKYCNSHEKKHLKRKISISALYVIKYQTEINNFKYLNLLNYKEVIKFFVYLSHKTVNFFLRKLTNTCQNKL